MTVIKTPSRKLESCPLEVDLHPGDTGGAGEVSEGGQHHAGGLGGALDNRYNEVICSHSTHNTGQYNKINYIM